MAGLHVNVVLLSTSRERVEAIRGAAKRQGFGCVVVADEQHASVAMHASNEGIFVVDASSAGKVLMNRQPNWLVLVLASQFDSSAWVELFKAGASEVIGDPLDARKLDAAFDGLIRQPPSHSQARNMWNTLVQRFGFGARTQMR